MPDTEWTFRTPPGLITGLIRALCSLRPAYSETPLEPLSAVIHRVRLDRRHLRHYARTCGFSAPDESVPLTYPHLLAAGLHLRLLLHPAFPVKPAGLIHRENRVECHAALVAGQAYRLWAGLRDGGRTSRGREFELDTELWHGEHRIWRERSLFLARAPVRGVGQPQRESPRDAAPQYRETETIILPAHTGREYARVSGDWNPIHLYPFCARWFGFRLPIAHGMYLQARILAALRARYGPAQYSEIRFRKPVLLPGTVHLQLADTGSGIAFRLLHPQGGLHAEGLARF